MKNIQKVYLSDEYTKFACKMGACANSCCDEEWGVEIQREEYDRALAMGIEKSLFQEYENRYGEVFLEIVPKNGHCAMRRGDGLCRVQCEHGVENLFGTCVEFPRSHGKLGNRMEGSLDTACERAVELVLFGEMQGLHETSMVGPVYWDVQISMDKLRRYMGGLEKYLRFRRETETLLSQKELTLGERVLLLGLFTEEYTEAVSAKNEIQIVEKWEKYTNVALKKCLSGYAKDQAFRDSFLESVLELLERQDGNLFASAGQRVSEVEEEALARLLKNQMFGEKYPFALGQRGFAPRRAFFRLGLSYALLRWILERTPDLDRTKMVQIVCKYTRHVEHDVRFLDDALEKISELGLAELELFSAFLL